MTPTEHATAATDLLTESTSLSSIQGGIPAASRYARLADVHAVLSKTSGAGTDYTAAEELIATAETTPWSPYLIDQALAHARLAPQA